MQKLLSKIDHLGEILAINNPSYWQSLVSGLAQQFEEPPPPSLTLRNISRKWELVSAFQKTVRRGDDVLAAHIASAMAGLLSERQYMWKRLCTVAAEDVGAGNPLLMCFVLAASSVFTPSTLNPAQTRALWAFLTRQMCLSPKSRLYCQFSLLQESQHQYGNQIQTFHSTELGRQIGKIVSTDFKRIAVTPIDKWLAVANWRAEGMAVGPLWHSKLHAIDHKAASLTPVCWSPEPSLILKGLPNYAYDKHTQVGKATLTRACALPQIRKVFHENPCADKRDALCWALFYQEGGKILNELRSEAMTELEQRLIADRLGISIDSWGEIRLALSGLIESGQLDEIRSFVLERRGYCDNCIRWISSE